MEENKLNKYLWSLDISTTNIGFSLWDSKGKLVEMKHLKLKLAKKITIVDRDLHKAEVFREYVERYKEHVQLDLNGVIDMIVVEEPLGGSDNPTTQALLYGFNGICRYILFTIFGIFPAKISVYNGRKIFCPELIITKKKRTGEIEERLSFPPEYKEKKKEYIWKKVAKLEPQIVWFYDKKGGIHEMCYDMSDSYVVGYAYLKLNEIL